MLSKFKQSIFCLKSIFSRSFSFFLEEYYLFNIDVLSLKIMYRNYFLGLFILQIFEICHNFTKLRSFLSKFELYVGKFPIISFWGKIADKLLLLSKKL